LKYKLIAIDLDGTVIDREGKVIPGAREAVQKAKAAGIKVTLATGRMYRPSNNFARELGLSDPLICYQGALIREMNDKATLWHKPLPVSLAREITEQIRHIGAHQYLYINDELFVEDTHDKDAWYAERNGVQLHVVRNLLTVLKSEPTEIAVRGDPGVIDRLMAHMNDHFGKRLIVTKVHSMFCEIVHPDTGKGNALKHLAGMMGIEQGETVAIGDGPNDITMLKWAGMSIVIGPAPEEVKAAADWVVDTPGDGFACAIEELLKGD
jgi:Cof subfamily protein (haloacid dehalogenase superfamily)